MWNNSYRHYYVHFPNEGGKTYTVGEIEDIAKFLASYKFKYSTSEFTFHEIHEHQQRFEKRKLDECLSLIAHCSNISLARKKKVFKRFCLFSRHTIDSLLAIAEKC